MNKAKNGPSAAPRPAGSASAEGDAPSTGKRGLPDPPGKGCLSQQSTFTEGKKGGWTPKTHLVFLEEDKEAEEFSGSGEGWAKFLLIQKSVP